MDLPPLVEGGSFSGNFGSVDPLPADSYYDATEESRDGWYVLGAYDNDGIFHLGWTQVDFEAPPTSGAAYKAVFVNTPTQGCTPGFWQGGTAGEQAGGRWLWNEEEDPDWQASGGAGWNPYIHDTDFCDFFEIGSCENMWYYVNPDMWDVNDDFHKAARSLTAAYLNASWGMAYAYSTSELQDMWNAAIAPGGDLLALHYLLDGANNAIGGCPISASIP
jgi:hypothetical protein